jgi:HAD superfamily hydrolase (TIGR01509 family)
MQIKAVIFDMDGVLIEAKEWHYESLNNALRLFGYEISRHDHLVTYDGLPTKKKLEMLSMESGLPTSLHAFINRLKQQNTMEIIAAQCKPVFYHQHALAKLKAEGYKLGVASNSIRKTVDAMLEHADLIQYVEFSLSNEDVSKPKPDPEIYTHSIQRMQLRPGECMIVEDNFNGIKAARAAGAHVMEVARVEDVNYANIKENIDKFEAGAG